MIRSIYRVAVSAKSSIHTRTRTPSKLQSPAFSTVSNIGFPYKHEDEKQKEKEPQTYIDIIPHARSSRIHYKKELKPSFSVRYYSHTTKQENTTLLLTLGTIAATAKAGQYALQAYEEWKASLPEQQQEEKGTKESPTDDPNTQSSSSASQDANPSGKRENLFSSFFNVGSKYYEGGFEDKMTKREAALILGVRESSTEKRIKEAHRKLLILNHPDTGGSTYLSGKINEAKELLLKNQKGRI